MIVQQSVLSLIVQLLKAKSGGEKGLQYLVAWSVFRQLMKYTVPNLLVGRSTKSAACYEHAKKAMRIAVTSPYYQTVVPRKSLEDVKTMLLNIRNAYAETFENSSWVEGQDRFIALQKLFKMRSYVGSPERYLDPAYVEQLYKSFPNVPLNRLFPSWIKAMSLSCHQKWADRTTHIFDETDVKAHYQPDFNLIVIPTAIITRPLYYLEAPQALNYGGLGMIVGHEIMHAYDAKGRSFDDEGEHRQWASRRFMEKYRKRTLCLRRTYKLALRRRARRDEVDDFTESEILADHVGVKTAYKAFSSLPVMQRTQTLKGLNVSAERLFFISHCMKMCAEYSFQEGRHAPKRLRCIVPLMNMQEFTNAFGCSGGQLMNPRKKCDFWS
ncbi:neprilysin-1-like [Rhipicephalus microplus]|uniref:neprilysin-1-like n=1 Tax=Rhipicephalus microplus TaxID=6941 RepID=UPI003F6CC230